jgi:predicted DsbA family dithiol-disulfide isomerase
MAKKLLIEVASDVICPWCYIGKRRLEKALEALKDDYDVRVEWLPFQLNPGMPEGGMARAEYRRQKFGSVEKGRTLDARVAQEGAGVGIDFAFDRMQRTPNTMAAHRLIDLAQRQDRASAVGTGRAGAVVDALFRAYFEEARDIGDARVLQEIAAAAGVQDWPAGADAQHVAGQEERVRDLGISGVPTFIFNKESGLSGAYPPEMLVQAIREAIPR